MFFFLTGQWQLTMLITYNSNSIHVMSETIDMGGKLNMSKKILNVIFGYFTGTLAFSDWSFFIFFSSASSISVLEKVKYRNGEFSVWFYECIGPCWMCYSVFSTRYSLK